MFYKLYCQVRKKPSFTITERILTKNSYYFLPFSRLYVPSVTETIVLTSANWHFLLVPFLVSSILSRVKNSMKMGSVKCNGLTNSGNLAANEPKNILDQLEAEGNFLFNGIRLCCLLV